ncbi:MAG: FmdB family zinc ribbon protein [Pirellula sp.]|jgi:predicted nucleic acid-binding Zn ribbon protein
MPIYVYEIINPDGTSGETFEVIQRMNEDQLQVHPDNGMPVRRVIGAPSIGGMWSDSAMGKSTDDSNLKRLGFTKYVKTDDGRYEKTLGSGPNSLSAD